MDIDGNPVDNSSRTPSPDISAAMTIDGNFLDNSSRTPSPDIDGESFDHLALTPSPNIDEESLDPFRTPPLRIPSPDLQNYTSFEDAVRDGLLRAPRSSPLSEVSLSLPSFSSHSPTPLPLPTIDEDKIADFNNDTFSISNFSNLTHSDSPNLPPLHTEDDDIDADCNDHPTSSDGSNLENDLAGPTLSDIRTAEAMCQLKNHQSYVEPMNSASHGPKRNSWAAEQSYGRQIRQPTPHPVLAQSINFANPAADNYGTYSFHGNSCQPFPLSAEAFEKHFPRAGFQIQPVIQSYEAHNQYRSQYGYPQSVVQSHEAYDQYRVPLASLQTQPIIQTHEDHNQYGSQYGQPQCGQPQYMQPRTLRFFEPQQNSDSQDAAAAHQNSMNTREPPQANTSRKRKSSDVTDTPTKRRRRTGQYAASHNRPPVVMSDDELKGRAVEIFEKDPWIWTVSDVYFSLTNTRSHELLNDTNNNALPHPHLGLILSKLVVDGPKLLVNFTQPFLISLGITRADHLFATMSLLDKIRARSPTYQDHRHRSLEPIPMASADTLAPQSAESKHAVLESMRQDIGSKPLKNGELRKYHFIFGCFYASLSGTEGQLTLEFNTVQQCLGMEQYTLGFNAVQQCLGIEQRHKSMVSQESDQQQQLDQHWDPMVLVSPSEHQQPDKHHRTSVSFVRGPSNGRRA